MVLKGIVLFVCSFFLVSCVTLTGNSISKEQSSTKQLAEEGIRLMNKKKYTKAREYFAHALKKDPRECHLHFLNGLSYQIEDKKASNYRLLDIAAIGYQSSIKFCPQEPWAYYYLGLINYQKKNYAAAEINFAQALKLGKGQSKLPFFGAFIRSAKKNNDPESIRLMLNQLKKIDPKSPLIKKLYRIIRQLDPVAPQTKNKGPEKDSSLVISRGQENSQLIVDAVFILSQESNEARRGVNLMNGLQLQYGITDTINRFGTSTWKHYANGINDNPTLENNSVGSNPALDYSSLITHALSLPAITYNLNIFSNLTEHNQIISRPSLLARDKLPAKYFSGSELLIGVSGLNSGQVQIIPIGLTLKVTPDFQEDGSINLDIMIGKSFINEHANTTVGGFQSSATALKEETRTNTNVHFGETIILSSLSETLNSYLSNKTPGIGDLPLLRLAFAHRATLSQNVSLLVLITPHEYVGFKNNARVPDKQVASLYRLVKKYIEPTSNYSVIARELAKLPIYSPNKVLSTEFYTKENLDGAINSNYEKIDVF
jgi:tetratricopeptide (TPR) repeat protein